jgi:fused signal recognition particle receptor
VNDAESGDSGRGGFWGRLKAGLTRTRVQLAQGVGNLLLGRKEIDDQVMEDLEAALLSTDVGVETTQEVMADLTERVGRRELADTIALHEALTTLLKARLAPLAGELKIDPARKPSVVLFVGVNGAGKTTTIGKLAAQLKASGRSVMLAAGDTFRAAAVEQLTTWGARNGVPVIAQKQGADSASVLFEAVEAARARGVDVLLADTAGRLLAKIKRVIGRLDPAAPHEVVLVLDAGIGQNALSQVREFDAAVGVTGLVLTKLDGTARAGVLFSIARQTPRPVYYVGVGEGIDDLRPFSAAGFVDALLARE